jgi:hypothetical protein
VIQRHVQDAVSELLIARSDGFIEEIEVSVEGDALRFQERMRESVGEES